MKTHTDIRRIALTTLVAGLSLYCCGSSPISPVASSPGGQNPKPGIEITVSGDTKTLAEHLGLTAHQRDALEAFKEQYLLEREVVLGDEPLDESDVTKELTENFEGFSEGFAAILTAEQHEEYDAIRGQVIGQQPIEVNDYEIYDEFLALMEGQIAYR